MFYEVDEECLSINIEQYEEQLDRIDELLMTADRFRSDRSSQTFWSTEDVATDTMELDRVAQLDTSLFSEDISYTSELLTAHLESDRLKIRLVETEGELRAVAEKVRAALKRSGTRFRESIDSENSAHALHSVRIHSELENLETEVLNALEGISRPYTSKNSLLDEMRVFRERLFPLRE